MRVDLLCMLSALAVDAIALASPPARSSTKFGRNSGKDISALRKTLAKRDASTTCSADNAIKPKVFIISMVTSHQIR